MNTARFGVALSCLALAGAANAQTLLRSVNGPAAGAQFGKACIVVPDQDSDGLEDLLVGAPEFNGGRGAIYCISSAYLATGTGPSVVWSLAPAVAAGDKFGFALANVRDVNFDGVWDFLVGEPGYDHGTSTDSGAVRLVDGATHTVLSLIHDDTPSIAFGSSMAACGDVDFDGLIDVAVGAPGPSPFFTQLFVLDGAWLQYTQQNNAAVMLSNSALTGGGHEYAASLAAGFDLDGDGMREIAVGVPGWDGPGAVDGGRIRLLEFRLTSDAMGNPLWVLDSLGSYISTIPGERLGQSLDVADDYDLDGVVDIVVGAPNSPNGSAFEVGRAVVLSGARFVAQTAPYEIYSFAFGSVTPPVNHSDPDPNFHLGAAVRACGDLSGDGVGEILVGAPGYFTQSFSGTWNFRGLVRVVSGATGDQLVSITGGSTDRLGDALAGSILDLNGDGFREFVVAGSLSDAGGTDSGVLKCYRIFPIAPYTYCTGKVNSLGCTPAIGFSGIPSASPGPSFLVTASNVINQKNGLLFYGRVPSATPFQGGTKCVADPIARTPAMSSGGSASGSDCSGTFSFDFNARIASGIDPSLLPGAQIYAQYWSRDPASGSHTSLSNALWFLIHP